MSLLLLAGLAFATENWVAPTVTATEFTTVGGLNPRQAWDGLLGVEAPLIACFNLGSAPVPTSLTSVQLSWLVKPDGHTDNIGVGGASSVPEFERCLASALTDATFPALGPETKVTARLALSPRSENAGRLNNATGLAPTVTGILTSDSATGGVLGALSDGEVSGIGGLIGARGTQLGAGGLGARGSGLGGGGTAEGLGGLGTARTKKPATRSTVEQADGDLTVGLVQTALARQQSALDACYVASLGRKAGTRGTVTTRLKFGKYGEAKKVKVEDDTTGDPDLSACIAGVLERLQPGVGGTARIVTSVDESNGWGVGGTGVMGGDPLILGALDKSLIDAVIKRYMNQIRYCYQRELSKNPSLAGKITVKFVIQKDGTVSSAVTKSTTMNNASVEECINGRFLKMIFPDPKGGGIVIVSYPFVFSPH